jgi:hypothetical protein
MICEGDLIQKHQVSLVVLISKRLLIHQLIGTSSSRQFNCSSDYVEFDIRIVSIFSYEAIISFLYSFF